MKALTFCARQNGWVFPSNNEVAQHSATQNGQTFQSNGEVAKEKSEDLRSTL
jgi:hypothetical protein